VEGAVVPRLTSIRPEADGLIDCRRRTLAGVNYKTGLVGIFRGPPREMFLACITRCRGRSHFPAKVSYLPQTCCDEFTTGYIPDTEVIDQVACVAGPAAATVHQQDPPVVTGQVDGCLRPAEPGADIMQS